MFFYGGNQSSTLLFTNWTWLPVWFSFRYWKGYFHFKGGVKMIYSSTQEASITNYIWGKPRYKENGKKGHNVTLGGRGGPPILFFSPSLPGPQIPWKWTMHPDKLSTTCHLCAYLQAGWVNDMCRIWDWQSTIVKDLNDNPDPKHTRFCRKNAFVTIYTFFQTTHVPFWPV